MYTNADQLVNKRDDLLSCISHDFPDVILVTECIPKAQQQPIDRALLSLTGYNLFTNFDSEEHCLGSKGTRGICVYVISHIPATEISFTKPSRTEHLWIRIGLQGTDQLIAGCIYRSPSGDAKQSVEELAYLFQVVLASNPSHLLICGDFNIPQINWALNFCDSPDSHFAHKFLNIVHECLLFQHVTAPTRYREGRSPSLLDLLFTNEEGMLSCLEYFPGLGKSDHVILRFQLNCYSSQVDSSTKRLNFNKANFSQLREMLDEVNWQCLATLDIDSGYKFFRDTLSSVVSACVPSARSSKSRKNIYMTSHALRLKRDKTRLWRTYMHTQEPMDLARFRVCRNNLRNLTRKLRRDFESQLVTDLKVNPKAFWKYSNSRLKTKPVIGDLRCSSGSLARKDEVKASILNTFFGSIFTQERLTDMPILGDRSTFQLSDIHITPRDVESKLQALNPSSAPGPDEIHPRVLREARRALGVPLTLLYRRSLDTGSVPRDWTLGRVVPIFKKGDRQDPGNYRPVSLTSVTCKVLESLIRDNVYQHLSDGQLWAQCQHGFRPRRSCSTQLVQALDDWSKALESHKPIDVLYLDFQKAFDSVPHQRLLQKLRCYGVRGKLITWIESFLTARRQQVVLNGQFSDWTEVASGVPQGSVLGPLLFLVYVNDLPDVVHCPLKMFADDTKLYSSVATPGEVSSLQADLDTLGRWSDTWQLPFNDAKCKVLHLGSNNPNSRYMMRGTELSDGLVEKDLGVHIDCELKFRQQASAAVAKGTQILAVIRRSFALINECTLPLLFKALVRPHLEYGNLVWGPFNRADQKRVERVQRRATRIMSSIRHLPYEERLRALQLPSLYYRRRRGDMIHTYQIFHGGVDVNPTDLFVLATGATTRGNPYKVFKPSAVVRVRRTAFAIRVIKDWNSLPAEVVCSPTVNKFKANLDTHWAHIRYQIPDTD